MHARNTHTFIATNEDGHKKNYTRHILQEPVNLTTVSARDVNPSTSPGVIQYGVLTCKC